MCNPRGLRESGGGATEEEASVSGGSGGSSQSESAGGLQLAFGTAKPRPPSALWPRPPPCSSWPNKRPKATRSLAKKPAATTTLTPARQPEAAKPATTTKPNTLTALGFSFWWHHQAQARRRAHARRHHQTPPSRPPVKPAPPTPHSHSRSPNKQEGSHILLL